MPRFALKLPCDNVMPFRAGCIKRIMNFLLFSMPDFILGSEIP